jgi:hypothetical protein
MVRKLMWVSAPVLALVLVPAPLRGQTAGDKEAVRQAALDYVEGIYQVQPERLVRSVHPALVKRGFYRRDADSTYQPMSQMTYDQLIALSRNWNKDGKQDTSVKEVFVYDVMDTTASVKIVAAWGIDYMQLSKVDGSWKIVNILWQSHPPKVTPTSSR